MFTGIIEELGQVQTISIQQQQISLKIAASLVLQDIKIGDSISVNGCCLTLTECSNRSFSCDVVEETLRKTTLGQLKVGDTVNLERPLQLQSRLGGHIVQGHIDGVGQIEMMKSLYNGSFWVTISASPELLRYVIDKGSIAVDGISLTIAERNESSFTFAMIPHTVSKTTLGKKIQGDQVNLEVDLLAKYVERLLKPILSR